MSEESNKLAQAICNKLQDGDDCRDDVKEFLLLGTPIPDGLIQASIGNRMRNAKACPKSLKMLLEADANPNCNDQLTEGPIIHSACWHGSVEVVKLLLDYKADLEAKEVKMGTPPLNTAIAAGNAKVCLELLNRNADVTWKHHDGASALHVAMAWIASSHNSNLRLPPVGEEPRAVIAMMLHNGVDPTQTEGMTLQSNSNRSRGMTPLETFQREIARSPWRTHAEIGPQFDKTAKTINTLLEQAEQAMKLKDTGNKAFSEKRNEDALKAWAEARSVWEKADIRGHHTAVLWSNEALCRRKMGEVDKAKEACNQGLTHYTTSKIREKLQFNLVECDKIVPEPTPEQRAQQEKLLEAKKEKSRQQKDEFKEMQKKVVDSGGAIYGEDGSAEKDYKVPPPFISSMDEAYARGIGPPPPPKPWWEKKEEDSDEEPERKHTVFLPAHHPNW